MLISLSSVSYKDIDDKKPIDLVKINQNSSAEVTSIYSYVISDILTRTEKSLPPRSLHSLSETDPSGMIAFLNPAENFSMKLHQVCHHHHPLIFNGI